MYLSFTQIGNLMSMTKKKKKIWWIEKMSLKSMADSILFNVFLLLLLLLLLLSLSLSLMSNFSCVSKFCLIVSHPSFIFWFFFFFVLIGFPRWVCQCSILYPIHIYWCKVCLCYRWILANQDWWLFPVSLTFGCYITCFLVAFNFNIFLKFEVCTMSVM